MVKSISALDMKWAGTTRHVLTPSQRWDLVLQYVRVWLRQQMISGRRGTQATLAVELGISQTQLSNVTSANPSRGIGTDLVMAVAKKLGFTLAMLEIEALRAAGKDEDARQTLLDTIDAARKNGLLLAVPGAIKQAAESSPPALAANAGPVDPWTEVESTVLFQLAPDDVKRVFRTRSIRLPPNRSRAVRRACEYLLNLQRDFEDGLLDARSAPTPYVESDESEVRERTSARTATKTR